jgi:diketogulonate reductase-like aldo/keto reductase
VVTPEYLDLYLIHFPISFKWREERFGVPKDEETGQTLFDSVPLMETWRAMEELVDAGLVRNIGVSNFNSQLLGDLLTYARSVSARCSWIFAVLSSYVYRTISCSACSIPPVVNQVEVHPLLSQERLLRYCQSVGVHVSAFSPLGSVSYEAFGGLAKTTVSPVDRDEVKDIAKKHGFVADLLPGIL